jgi:hypothetical protein
VNHHNAVSIYIYTSLYHKKSLGKTTSIIMVNLVSLKKFGLLYSRIGARAARAGSKFLPELLKTLGSCVGSYCHIMRKMMGA